MKKIDNQWPVNSNSRNLLFFAQIMGELTCYTSWDNYRAYTLDTIARLEDLSKVAKDIDSEEVRQKHLADVKDEAIWSLENDPIVKEIFGDRLIDLINSIRQNNLSNSDLTHRSSYLIDQISNAYQNTAEKLIKAACFNGNKKVETRHKIRQLASCYCSFLLRKGYNKSYIEEKIDEHFFKKNHKRFTKQPIEKFFNCFDNVEKEFRIYVKLKNKYAVFLNKIFGFTIVQYSSLPKCCKTKENKFFKAPNGYNILYMGTPKALDPYAAREMVHSILQSLKSVTWLETVEFSMKWQSSMVAHQANTQNVFKVHKRGHSIKQRRSDILGTAEERFIKSISKLFTKRSCFEPSSRSKLLRSLDTYSQAIEARESDTQLVSMWAALEALLTERKNLSKIDHYKKYITCSVCTNYPLRMFEAAYYDFYQIYKDDFLTIIEKNKNRHRNPVIKFTEIIVLKEFESIRTQLFNMVKENPLATYRILDLNTKYASNKKSRILLDKHEMRVNWQISRIYRTRNNIVHAGKSSNYIDNLIVNLDTYYRALINAILTQSDQYSSPVSLDRILSDIYMIHDQKKEILKRDDRVNKDILKTLLTNKLS